MTHDTEGRVTHAILYDEAVVRILAVLSGDAADAAYGPLSRSEDEGCSPEPHDLG